MLRNQKHLKMLQKAFGKSVSPRPKTAVRTHPYGSQMPKSEKTDLQTGKTESAQTLPYITEVALHDKRPSRSLSTIKPESSQKSLNAYTRQSPIDVRPTSTSKLSGQKFDPLTIQPVLPY